MSLHRFNWRVFQQNRPETDNGAAQKMPRRNKRLPGQLSFVGIDWEPPVVSRVVLVVDDEAMVLDVTASMLEDLGCEVVTARGGNDALRKLSTDARIEVLITDINMPGMDGYELAEKATRMREELKVIVLSGHANDARGFPLIRKPFLESDLKRTMAQHTGLC